MKAITIATVVFASLVLYSADSEQNSTNEITALNEKVSNLESEIDLMKKMLFDGIEITNADKIVTRTFVHDGTNEVYFVGTGSVTSVNLPVSEWMISKDDRLREEKNRLAIEERILKEWASRRDAEEE